MLRFDHCMPEARTIVVCISPYNMATRVADSPDFEPYQELFRPGVFRDQVEQAQSRPLRIWLNCEHRKGVDNVIGHAVGLLDLLGGLYGSFRVHDGIEGDEALAKVRDGALTGVSMQATPLRSRTVDGVTQRLRAHLCGVSLCPHPAYADARVLGIRRGWRIDQPGPASTAEHLSWELDRLEGKLRAVACECIDESPRSYTRDPRYQGALRLGAQIKEERAEIERRLRPQPALGLEAAVQPEALRPKVLRRVVSGPIAIR